MYPLLACSMKRNNFSTSTLPLPSLLPSFLHPLSSLHPSSPHSCEIPLGDIQSEEERDIVLELLLPSLEAPHEGPVLKVSLSYFNVVTSALENAECEMVANRSGEWVGCEGGGVGGWECKARGGEGERRRVRGGIWWEGGGMWIGEGVEYD